MKKNNPLWFYPYVVVTSLLLLTSSCKKEEEPSSITDADGNSYTSVKIGTQVWMVENLRTTKYNNGDLIGTTNPLTLNISGESNPKYQWPINGDENKVSVYGRLYTWHAITDNRGVCPKGWHLPSDAEWTTLTTFIGGETVAGGKLKEIGTSHWNNPNSASTDDYGFKALPGGDRDPGQGFYSFGYYGMWWSATEFSNTLVHCRELSYSSASVSSFDGSKMSGFCVRCVKN